MEPLSLFEYADPGLGMSIFRLSRDISPADPAAERRAFRLAPVTMGSLYFGFQGSSMDTITGKLRNSKAYVAVTYVVALATLDDAVSEDSLAQMQAGVVTSQNVPTESQYFNDMRFLGSHKGHWKGKLTQEPLGQFPKIPTRDANGVLEWVTVTAGYRMRLSCLLDDKLTGQRVGGKPARHVSVPGITVHVFPFPGESERLDRRLGKKPGETSVFETLIRDMQSEYTKYNVGYRVKLATDDPHSDTNMVRLATDPFTIFSSFVTQADWNKYMEWLDAHDGSPSIRNFPDQPRKWMKTVVRELIRRDQWVARLAGDIYNELSQEERKQKKQAAEKDGNGMEIIEDVNANDSEDELALAPDNPGDDDLGYDEENAAGDGPAAPKGSNVNFKQQKLRLRMMDSWMRKTFQVNDYKRSLSTTLDSMKMIRAAGKRKRQPGQAAVMGSVSANRVEIAREMGWHMGNRGSGRASKFGAKTKDGKLKGPGWVSEWLHLSAFSFGGFDDEEHAYETSQVPENLVFGTGECNSLMTRYEMAWQALFDEEDSLETKWKKEEAVKKSGTLEILTNHSKYDSDIVFDIEKNGNFTHEKIDLATGANLDDLKGNATGPPQGTDRFTQKVAGGTKTIITSLQALRQVCRENPFMAYRIHYSLTMNESSRLLKRGVTKGEFDFFPFRRPMYHAIEADLDDRLFEQLKQAAAEEAKVEAEEEKEKKPTIPQAPSETQAQTKVPEPWAVLFKQHRTEKYHTKKTPSKQKKEANARGKPRPNLDAARDKLRQLMKSGQPTSQAEMWARLGINYSEDSSGLNHPPPDYQYSVTKHAKTTDNNN